MIDGSTPPNKRPMPGNMCRKGCILCRILCSAWGLFHNKLNIKLSSIVCKSIKVITWMIIRCMVMGVLLHVPPPQSRVRFTQDQDQVHTCTGACNFCSVHVKFCIIQPIFKKILRSSACTPGPILMCQFLEQELTHGTQYKKWNRPFGCPFISLGLLCSLLYIRYKLTA